MSVFTHITTSGGLISAAFIENVREVGSRQRGIELASFVLPWSPAPRSPAAMEETIAAAWELLLERWDAVRAGLPMMDVSQVRARWLLPLFQLLDFDPVYLRGDTVLDEAGRLRYPLSHRGWPVPPVPSAAEGSDSEGSGENAPVLHTVIPSQDLDARMTAGRGASTGSARGLKAKSPHDMLQAFLNASPADLWAVLSNGVMLRLLRDYHHTFTKGYVQFDLESIFETRNYGDFRALYRTCHASRFVPWGEGDEALLPLEQFYKDSIATGIKVGEDLRGQVRQAIETLGNGFLYGELIGRLQADEALCRRYYGEVLHVIYRVLFLLFAEQRGMLPRIGAPLEDLYRGEYGIAALRARAEGDLPRQDDFTDLWEGLNVTFHAVREGAPDLGVFGYDGVLFAEDQTPLLNGRGIRNSDLLRAIRALTLIEREGVLQRISYADLGVEELGAIYESLLDFTPRVTTGPDAVNGREIPANTFFLDPRGSERKTTGSYYTHPSLVNELIKSALLPVARDRLAAAGLPVVEEAAIGEATAGLLTDYAGLSDALRAAGEKALLSIKACDPAAGSGHFLVKANNALGAELARVRTGDEYPTEDEIQAARRDVLAHCLYAVDLNPMAVELCKVSLWINASVGDRPLSFLDHHIKCGNSLIGATPELMDDGVPYEAFALGIAGDDREVAKRFRARNREERRDFERSAGYQLGLQVTVIETVDDLKQWSELAQLAEDQPQMARERYVEYLAADEHRRQKLEADFWTAAFFWPMPQGTRWAPTFAQFLRLRDQGPEALPAERLLEVEDLAGQHRFFHWHLEFPDVFGDKGRTTKDQGVAADSSAVSRPSSDSGFDAVLGNPPWERIKLQEKEFFADKDPAIANARMAATRRKLIRELSRTNPELYSAYTVALRESEATSQFLHSSGRYPLSAVGDINTYQVFCGLARQIAGSRGRVGIVVPTGIATDTTNKQFFQDLMVSGMLASLYDFENRTGLFPNVDSRMKFCLLTLRGSEWRERDTADFFFFARSTPDLADQGHHYSLSMKNIQTLNPNTWTSPIFKSKIDAEISLRVYENIPIFALETNSTRMCPWDCEIERGFRQGEQEESLKRLGFGGSQLLFTYDEVADREEFVPLYEGKTFDMYDHRRASIVLSEQALFRPRQPRETTLAEHQSPSYVAIPYYWVKSEVAWSKFPWDWFIGFKKVTSVTNERTMIAAILPKCAVNDTVHILRPCQSTPVHLLPLLLANLCSLALDYLGRQKVGGNAYSMFIAKQLPIIPPDWYVPDHFDFIIPRVVELTYTAWDLQPYAQDVLDEVGPETWAQWFKDAPVHTSPPPAWAEGDTPTPFVWDEARRARLRAELDALYAHLYGLTHDELAYILDTFPIVWRKDEEKYGEYRTKRMILENYDVLDSRMR